MIRQEKLTYPARHRGSVHVARCGGPMAHAHEELELNLVLSGHGYYVVDGVRYKIKRGTLLWLFPKQMHILADSSEDFAMWVAVFRPDLVGLLADDHALRQDQPMRVVGLQAVPGDTARLDELCCEIRDAWAAKPEATALFNAGLHYLMLLAWQIYDRSQRSPVTHSALHPAVYRAISVLQQAPATSLARLAEAAKLTPAHVSRLFCEQMGQTLTEYRTGLRLGRFMHHLRESPDLTKQQAAEAAGFGSYSQALRCFRARHGCSPRQYLNASDEP